MKAKIIEVIPFLFSPKGRLNRFPYNGVLILALAIFFIHIISFALSISDSIDQKTFLDLDNESRISCTAYYSVDSTSSKRDIESCVKKTVVLGLLKKFPWNFITILIMISSFLLVICPTIRRLHDRGKSAWWYLGFTIASFIPYIDLLALIWFFVETSLLRGTVGPNDYGPDPIE